MAIKPSNKPSNKVIVQVQMTLEKSTPGTFRFTEVTDDGEPTPRDATFIGKLYVRKEAFTGEPPENITVTIAQPPQ
jgi:hypothetical protein